MATEEAVILRRVQAEDRVRTAVAALVDRHGVTAATAPQLPREVDPAFRAMVASEVLADTLERLVDNTMVSDLIAQTADQQRRIAELEAELEAEPDGNADGNADEDTPPEPAAKPKGGKAS